jgi:hypothetical protein
MVLAPLNEPAIAYNDEKWDNFNPDFNLLGGQTNWTILLRVNI